MARNCLLMVGWVGEHFRNCPVVMNLICFIHLLTFFQAICLTQPLCKRNPFVSITLSSCDNQYLVKIGKIWVPLNGSTPHPVMNSDQPLSVRGCFFLCLIFTWRSHFKRPLYNNMVTKLVLNGFTYFITFFTFVFMYINITWV